MLPVIFSAPPTHLFFLTGAAPGGRIRAPSPMPKLPSPKDLIPVRLNMILAAGFVALNAFQFFGVPLLLHRDSAFAWLLVLFAFTSNSFWALIHEAIHGAFHPHRSVNDATGRVMAVFFGSPLNVVRTGHLLHHRFNRTLDITEVWDPAKMPRGRFALRYYGTILGGIYLGEVGAALIAWLPATTRERVVARIAAGQELLGRLLRGATGENHLATTRTDALAVLLLVGISAWLYGEFWPLLVGVFAARAFFISFLDNVFHYDTPVGDTRYARDHRLPRWLSAATLNFNHHGVHHRHPALPWTELPAQHRNEGGAWQAEYFTAAIAQIRGPIEISLLPQAAAS